MLDRAQLKEILPGLNDETTNAAMDHLAASHYAKEKRTMNTPTRDELWEEALEDVWNESLTGWRHGTDEKTVFHREEDDTYWMVDYKVSTDGESHGIRDDTYTIAQVRPVKRVVTEYEKI